MLKRALGLVFAATAFALLLYAPSSRANPDFDLGPAINAKVPDIGSPRDYTGAPRTLGALRSLR